MYRYPVDQAVTYTPEDLVLFRDSPFACWMERITLENPGHGIAPDAGSSAPQNISQRQDDLADTLRAEGHDIALIDWDQDEPGRRAASREAMCGGVDFIVNAHLAVGPLSGSANLLMRSSGSSELGEFLYIPCDTQVSTTQHSVFRLCFLADLLHSLQGQLPAQMLLIRGSADLLSLQTEDHIYYYRAVKQRFMEAMQSFRKHRMPDPAESSQKGRWSACANDILKQRALAAQSQSCEVADTEPREPMSQLIAERGPSPYDREEIRESQSGWTESRIEVEVTAPDSASAGPPPLSLVPVIGIDKAHKHTAELPEQKRESHNRPQYHYRNSDVALHNLLFAGKRPPDPQLEVAEAAAPAENVDPATEPALTIKPHPLDSVGVTDGAHSMIDADTVLATSLNTLMNAADSDSEDEADDTDRDSVAWAAEPEDEFETDSSVLSHSFSDGLVPRDRRGDR